MPETARYDGSALASSSHLSAANSAFVYTMVWLFPLFCAAGIFFNFSNLAVVLKFRHMFSPSARIFIAFICAANGGTLLVKGPTHYLESLGRFNLTWWHYERESISRTSAASCRIYTAITYLTLVGTPYYQLGLTLDRVVCVLQPIKNRNGLSPGLVWVTIATITTIAASMAIFGALVIRYDPGHCSNPITPTTAFDAFRRYEFIVGRVILLACMLVGTVIILIALRGPEFTQKLPPLPQQPPVSKLTRKRPHRKTTLILVLLNVTYMLCSLPAGLYVAARTADPGLEKRIGELTHNLVHMVLNTLMYFDFCLNGGTLLASRRFRIAFAATVCCSRCRVSRHSGGGNRVSGTARNGETMNNGDSKEN